MGRLLLALVSMLDKTSGKYAAEFSHLVIF